MSAKLEEIILDLNRRITELESTRQKSYSSPFELNSVAHGKNTARRINVNDQHYIDADGTANLKSVSLDDGYEHDIVGLEHTASGLTTGHFLKATGINSFGFAAHGLTYSDVGAAPSTHDHNTTYPTISSVFGNLTSNYLPRYNGSGGFVNSPLYHEGTNHIRLGTYFSMWGSDDNETYLLHNIYYGSSAFRYRETTAAAGASLIQSEGQRIIIRVAPDGIKDDSVVFNNYLLLNNLVLQTQNNFYAGGVLTVAGSGDNIITGNLAIGNFTPVYKLHVKGSAVIAGALGIANAITSPTNYWNFYVDSAEFGLKDNVATTWPLRILKGAPTNSIRVLANGNVGINTVTPSEKLTVTGNILSTYNVVGNNGCYAYNPTGQGNYIGVFKGAGSLPGYNTSYYPTIKTDYTHIYFSTNNSFVAELGMVGTQKIFKFASAISSTATPDCINLGETYANSADKSKCKLILHGSSGGGIGVYLNGLMYHDDESHGFYVNNTQKLMINTYGLGIGKTAAFALDVIGNAVVTGYIQAGAEGVYAFNNINSGQYIGFFKSANVLPGIVSSAAYPTIKTDYAYMYFANEVTYLGHFGGNTSQKIFGIYSGIRRTSTPDYIDTGLSYSDGKTSDKCKIYLYRNTNQYYGFGIGDEGDVQYHSDAYHDFYILNKLRLRVRNSGVSIIPAGSDGIVFTGDNGSINRINCKTTADSSLFIEASNVMQLISDSMAIYTTTGLSVFGTVQINDETLFTDNVKFNGLSQGSTGYELRLNSSTQSLTVVVSSKRYKANIRYNVDTDFIYKLKPCYYDFKDGSVKNEIGLIAEDVFEAAPQYVFKNKNDEIEGYNKSEMIPALINEIQKLKKEIDILKAGEK